jgi:hypothetical protein
LDEVKFKKKFGAVKQFHNEIDHDRP